METKAITRAVKKNGGEIMENKLTEVYEEIFKNSKIAITKNSFSGDNVLWVQLYLAQNKQEEINGYFENDMFDIIFKITKTAENNYTIENRQNRYLVKPTNKYLVYEGKKVAFRKTQGNEDKIITTFKKYVENLHNALVEDLKQGNIHENHITLLKQKLGE